MNITTKTSHTPAPWTLEDAGFSGGVFPSLICYRGVPVAKALDNCDTIDETFANARLIAAAPDLLKLLREVLEWNEDDGDLATNDTAFRLKNFADTVSNRSAALKAAIAKATGAK